MPGRVERVDGVGRSLPLWQGRTVIPGEISYSLGNQLFQWRAVIPRESSYSREVCRVACLRILPLPTLREPRRIRKL